MNNAKIENIKTNIKLGRYNDNDNKLVRDIMFIVGINRTRACDVARRLLGRNINVELVTHTNYNNVR